MLLSTNQDGNTTWHQAVNRGISETLQKVWDCAKEILTKEELSELFLGTDQCGRKAWHQAAGLDSSETLHTLWEFAKEILTK